MFNVRLTAPCFDWYLMSVSSNLIQNHDLNYVRYVVFAIGCLSKHSDFQSIYPNCHMHFRFRAALSRWAPRMRLKYSHDSKIKGDTWGIYALGQILTPNIEIDKIGFISKFEFSLYLHGYFVTHSERPRQFAILDLIHTRNFMQNGFYCVLSFQHVVCVDHRQWAWHRDGQLDFVVLRWRRSRLFFFFIYFMIWMLQLLISFCLGCEAKCCGVNPRRGVTRLRIATKLPTRPGLFSLHGAAQLYHLFSILLPPV